ncbi:MAG: hypothetical protein LBT20_02265 [Clostridiales bacterium]|jgi:hypothetical protein|nr:hypothetical protein [Clostridiales bacterium]
MKKYYSPTKPYATVKKHYPLFHTARFFLRPFLKPKLILSEPLPDEPVIFMANHARMFGPVAMLFARRRPFRAWSNANLVFVKTSPRHMMRAFIPNANGVERFFVRILASLIAPPLASALKATGTIPVYRDLRIRTTYDKTFETLKEGLDILIFPDSIFTDDENPYVGVLNDGAFKIFSLAATYYDITPPPVCPVYCCKDLKTVCIGNVLRYDTNIDPKTASENLKKAVSDGIKALGESLPPHKIIAAADVPNDPEKLKKYMTDAEIESYRRLQSSQRKKVTLYPPKTKER